MFDWRFYGDSLGCDVVVPPENPNPPSSGGSSGGSSHVVYVDRYIGSTGSIHTGSITLPSAPDLSSHITPTGNTTLDGNPIYKVANPLTENICTDLVKVYDVEELLARDTKGSEFKGYIDILTMFRALEKDEDVNGPTFTLYKNDGVVLNNDLFNG